MIGQIKNIFPFFCIIRQEKVAYKITGCKVAGVIRQGTSAGSGYSFVVFFGKVKNIDEFCMKYCEFLYMVMEAVDDRRVHHISLVHTHRSLLSFFILSIRLRQVVYRHSDAGL